MLRGVLSVQKTMMAEAPTQSTENKLKDVLDYIWATTGKIGPDKFTLAVDWSGWTELGGTAKIMSLTFSRAGQVFDVIPIPGLPAGSVALIWQ